ncbi:MAG: cell division protein ZapA [Proteobacteria bacterium]|nr:cell division protein ZapA [Pseudomonadota bacterium]
MAEVTIAIKGRQYDISCDDGQELRVNDLAKYIDRKVIAINKSGAAKNESHLMVLATLVLADELFETKEAFEELMANYKNAAPQPKQAANSVDYDDEITEKLQKLTNRIEDITDILEQTA